MLMNGFYTEGGGARSIMSPNTTARKVPGGYVLNGHKAFSTLVPVVDYFGLSTSLEGYTGSASGGCVFLRPGRRPGSRSSKPGTQWGCAPPVVTPSESTTFLPRLTNS